MLQIVPRRTPVQLRSRATIDYVLGAAAHILEADGLAGLNTNAVARRAGVSIGSLYQYFPRKEAIIATLIERSHTQIVEGLRALLPRTEGAGFRAAIDAMIDMLFVAAPRSPRVAHILETEEERLPKTPGTLAAEAEIDELNRAFLARYLDVERIGEAGLQTAARDVVGIVRALLDASTAEGDTPELRARLHRTVTGYLAPLLRAGMAA